jgi:hypothetical protein
MSSIGTESSESRSEWPFLVFVCILVCIGLGAFAHASRGADERSYREDGYATEMRTEMKAEGLVITEEIGSHRTVVKVDGFCLVTLDHYRLTGSSPEFVTLAEAPLPIQWAVDRGLPARLKKLCNLEIQLSGVAGIEEEPG